MVTVMAAAQPDSDTKKDPGENRGQSNREVHMITRICAGYGRYLPISQKVNFDLAQTATFFIPKDDTRRIQSPAGAHCRDQARFSAAGGRYAFQAYGS